MSDQHLSRLALARLATDDLDDGSVDARAHLAACTSCRDRHARALDDQRRFAAEVDVPARVEAILRAAGPRRRWAWGGATAAAVAAIALVIALRPAPAPPPYDGRPKGGDRLTVLRRTATGAEIVVAGSRLAPDDAIRFEVEVRTTGYVGVLGIDAAAAVTMYAPATDTLAVLSPGAPVLLDGSIILDRTLGPERIVMVVCDTPRPVADVIADGRDALERAGGDPRRIERVTSCREQMLVIEKVAR